MVWPSSGLERNLLAGPQRLLASCFGQLKAKAPRVDPCSISANSAQLLSTSWVSESFDIKTHFSGFRLPSNQQTFPSLNYFGFILPTRTFLSYLPFKCLLNRPSMPKTLTLLRSSHRFLRLRLPNRSYIENKYSLILLKAQPSCHSLKLAPYGIFILRSAFSPCFQL